MSKKISELDKLSTADGDTWIPVAKETTGDWDNYRINAGNISGGSNVTVSSTPPVAPNEGDLWYDDTSSKLYLYIAGNSTAWVQTNGGGGSGTGGGASVTTAAVAPSNPTDGDLWFDENNAELYVYTDAVNGWVQTNGGGSGGGTGGGGGSSWSSGWVNKAAYGGTLTNSTTLDPNNSSLALVGYRSHLKFDHNLGTSDINIEVFVADDANGTNAVNLDSHQSDDNTGDMYGAQVYNITTSSLTVALGSKYMVLGETGLAHYTYGTFTDKYIKVIASTGGSGGGSGGGEMYESVETAIPVTNTEVTFNHNLSKKPDRISYKLVCKAAEWGYEVGDEIHYSGSYVGAGGWATFTADDSKIKMSVYMNNVTTGPWYVDNRGTPNSAQYITNDKWKIVVHAFAETSGGGTSGGSSSVSISMGSSMPIHGDVVAALVIDQTIFIAEGDQSGLSNLQLGQFTFPDLVLEDLIIPIKDPISGKTNPNSPGGWNQSDEWMNDTITLTADWFGSDGSTIDIYVGHGSAIRFSKFTYNRSTRTCSPIEYLGKEKHGHDSDSDAIVGVHGSDLYTTRVHTDDVGRRRRVRTIGFEPDTQKTENGITWTEYKRKLTGSGTPSNDKYYLPELTPGPFGLVEGVEWTDAYYDNTYMSVAGINPWTGRMYFKVDGFQNGLEVWQIDPGHKPADGNYVGALSTIVDGSYGSKTGKLSYIKNTKLPLSADCTLGSARNRLDISFDVDTQKPLWVFAPGYSGDRDGKFGSLAPWNPSWT